MSSPAEHLRKTRIITTKDSIFYDEDSIRQQMETIDPLFKPDASSRERSEFKAVMSHNRCEAVPSV